jgi:site-specific DNA recombinase
MIKMKETLNNFIPNIKKIITYLRGNSIDGQRIYIQRWAKQNGFHIQKEFCEESSAFQGKRPIFEEMLDYAIDNKDIIDGIVVYALSRFARTQKQLITDNGRLEDAGLKLISVTEAMPEDEDSAFLMKNVLGTVNELYSRQGSRVVKDRLAVTAEKGFYTGGVVPFGFQSIETNDNDGTRSRKTLIHEPTEAEVVKDIYDLYNNGNSKGEVFSFKKIAKSLNEDGRLKRGKKWAVNDIHRVIKQTVNYGEYQFNSKPKGRPEKSYIINFPKIIERETFDVAEKLRDKKTR